MTEINQALVQEQAEVLRLIDQSGCTATQINYEPGDKDRGRGALVHLNLNGYRGAMGHWSGSIEELRSLSLVLKAGTDPRPR
jgi:hypothetical protein